MDYDNNNDDNDFQGEYLGLQRKINLSGDEYLFFGPGKEVPVFDIGELRIILNHGFNAKNHGFILETMDFILKMVNVILTMMD